MPIPSNLLDEQSLDSSGSEILGDESSNNDVNTEDSNDNTNFYISDYDYYYYDITDWVDDWLEYYFYYDYDLFEESSSNFYIGSSTVPMTFHDHLGNIFHSLTHPIELVGVHPDGTARPCVLPKLDEKVSSQV